MLPKIGPFAARSLYLAQRATCTEEIIVFPEFAEMKQFSQLFPPAPANRSHPVHFEPRKRPYIGAEGKCIYTPLPSVVAV